MSTTPEQPQATTYTGFHPLLYPYFDGFIAQASGLRALYDNRHRQFQEFEGLRANLATLRQHLAALLLQQAQQQPTLDTTQRLSSMAMAVGEALRRRDGLLRPLAPPLRLQEVKKPASGAKHIYAYLQQKQATDGLANQLALRLGGVDRAWNLPPLATNDRWPARPPEPMAAPLTDAIREQATASIDAVSPTSNLERLVGLADRCFALALTLPTPEQIQAVRQPLPLEAAYRQIRQWQNSQQSELSAWSWLERGTVAQQLEKAARLESLLLCYANALKDAHRRYVHIASEPAIIDASDAAGALALALVEHTLYLLSDEHEVILRLGEYVERVPKSVRLRQDQSLSRLLILLADGLRRATHTTTDDASPADRLVEIAERIHRSAKQLRSVDSMEPPAREESIELAREILRRLKNMQFSNKTPKELIEQTSTQEKLAAAEQMDEMVDSYATLLKEAVETNQQLLSDREVKDANDAVGQMAHTVKLMAAKEMPGSVAAAQQISADVTQMPEEWKHLSDRTVGRIVQSMEGGLEKAVGEIDMQQEEQQQRDEEISQAADQAQQQVHALTGRRRRRRSQRSGAGGAKQTKIDRDIRADDAVLKQGRFAEEKPDKPIPTLAGLKDIDMAAVKALGGALRDINQQAETLAATQAVAPPTAPSLSSSPVGDKMMPQDQPNFVQQVSERSNRPKPPTNKPKQK